MVTIAQLKQANPAMWQSAAEGWLNLAKESEQACNDIHDQGRGPLDEHWQDRVGQAARGQLARDADTLEAGADIMRGVAMVLDGLTTSIEYAQRTLQDGLDLAARYSFDVDGQTGALTPNGSGDVPEGHRYGAEVSALLDEALRQAGQADRKAADELRRLAGTTGVTDPDVALNRYQGEASQTELSMYRGDIPDGSDPALVSEWWDSLTPQQQEQLKLSNPVEIAGLDGIPDGVKQELRGTDGKFDRVEFVRWTMEHWDDDNVDIDGENNCTNFASEGLHHSGVQYKGWNTLDDDGWGKSTAGGWGWDWLDRNGHTHTNSWGGAQNLHDFLNRNGSHEVPLSQAKPGDIIFFEEASDQNEHIKQGTIHHTAVVTAVTPDGDIRYTQHSDQRLNVSLNGREHHETTAEGQQNIRVVRVEPNWY
ncbi:amidase domain-containing protein [Streptomyces sp. NPDC001380]|uniref:amidase domain-containing protein n=1 Tax=Streptomyces sp. NPDC001380 TaxID=3364566 RepID=UPI00368694CA